MYQGDLKGEKNPYGMASDLTMQLQLPDLGISRNITFSKENSAAIVHPPIYWEKDADTRFILNNVPAGADVANIVRLQVGEMMVGDYCKSSCVRSSQRIRNQGCSIADLDQTTAKKYTWYKRCLGKLSLNYY